MQFRVEDIRDSQRPPAEERRRSAAEAIRALARPRLTGSDGAAETAAALRHRLEALGYEVRDVPFSFSTWPGRFGLPLVGGLYLLDMAAATALLWDGRGPAALLVLLAGVLAIGALLALARPAIRRLGRGRVETADWLVQRPGTRPRYLVMAHRDSKSQPVSTLARTAGIIAAIAAWAGLVAAAAAAAVEPTRPPAPLLLGAGAVALLGGAALAFSWAGNRSPGALDNASGLAALLDVAGRERGARDVGFVVTDGEELGLAGAHAIKDRLPPVLGIINLDGLDDGGELRVVDGHGWRRRGRAPRLTDALLGAAGALGVAARCQGLPPGMRVDHIPLAEAGLPAVTVMRGTLGSLRRVHRPRDEAARMDGTGAAVTAAVVCGALRLLRGSRETE